MLSRGFIIVLLTVGSNTRLQEAATTPMMREVVLGLLLIAVQKHGIHQTEPLTTQALPFCHRSPSPIHRSSVSRQASVSVDPHLRNDPKILTFSGFFSSIVLASDSNSCVQFFALCANAFASSLDPSIQAYRYQAHERIYHRQNNGC